MILNRPVLVLTLAITPALPAQQLITPRDSARHALNRLGYGASATQLEAVAKTGVLAWIDRQVAYDHVDDPALDRRMAELDALRIPTRTLVAAYTSQTAKALKVQAQTADSAERQRMMRELRDQPGGRNEIRDANAQLGTATLIRAVESERQLAEVMTDFWSNHFNVFIGKNLDRALYAEYRERTIRDHAFGKFEDLLIATAKSPAMLFYLDNVQSVADGTAPRDLLPARTGRATAAMDRRRALRPDVPPPRGADPERMAQVASRLPKGINENYARELMELHTLGVDGGYSQQDIINVARILTGWGIDRATGSFDFRDRAHDIGSKAVLGQAFPAGGGEEEGIKLLKFLAAQPATMHHVSAKLCARFVADVPPDGCVDDAVHAWQRSGGDIRSVLRAIFHSPDFWAPANVSSKVKTPLEFVVSAVRAVGGSPDATPRLAQQVARLGQPLFQKQTPNGYAESEDDWVNSGALLARMNLAVALAAGRLPGVTLNLDAIVPPTADHTGLVTAVDRAILGGGMTSQTRKVILDELSDVRDPSAARALAVGLALGGPEFQRQ